MKKYKGFTIIVISLALVCSLSVPTFAKSLNDYNVIQDRVEEQGSTYGLVEREGKLYFTSFAKNRMGGGIGRPKEKNKTFSYSMTRSQAQAALKVINIGEGTLKSLGGLLVAILPGPVGEVTGLATSAILNFLGGDSDYVRNLKNFLASGRPTAYLRFKTHYVNRGYMYGDPMYDYVVDSIYIVY